MSDPIGPYTIDPFTPEDVAANLRGLADDLDGAAAADLDEQDLADLMLLSMLARSIVDRAGDAPQDDGETPAAATAPDPPDDGGPRLMAFAAGMATPKYRNLRPRPKRRPR